MELENGEEILLKENIVSEGRKKALALTSRRLLFLSRDEIENEIRIKEISEAYPHANVYTDQTDLKIRLQNGSAITVNWWGKSFLDRVFSAHAGEYARTNTDRYINAINKLLLVHATHIDFERFFVAMKKKGVILKTIECPNCSGILEVSEVPKKEEVVQCRYCGKSILAINLFEKFRDILGTG